HHPHQLSGGMRKRVSLAAALINEPSILLMDEPFGALDVQTKAMMSNELLGLWEQTRPSVIFVTHDLEEAIALADQVVVMTAGPGEAEVAVDAGRSTRRRKTLLWVARIATLVIVIGGWQLLTTAKIIDPFFWGQPSGIAKQLVNWGQHGTAYGSIWLQVWVTFK